MFMGNTQTVVINSILPVPYPLKEFRFFTFNLYKFTCLKYPFISFNSTREIFNSFSNRLNIFFSKIAYLPECIYIKCIEFFLNPSSNSADNCQIISFFFFSCTYSVIVNYCCLLYTSDAADEEDSVDLGGRGIL